MQLEWVGEKQCQLSSCKSFLGEKERFTHIMVQVNEVWYVFMRVLGKRWTLLQWDSPG